MGVGGGLGRLPGPPILQPRNSPLPQYNNALLYNSIQRQLAAARLLHSARQVTIAVYRACNVTTIALCKASNNCNLQGKYNNGCLALLIVTEATFIVGTTKLTCAYTYKEYYYELFIYFMLTKITQLSHQMCIRSTIDCFPCPFH